MRALLLSAYDAISHRYWREGLCQYFNTAEWTVLTLPPRFFRWRMRGNPLSWLHAAPLRDNYDLVVATSMVDLSVLRGLFPPLAAVPTLQYFHENQFAYPTSKNHRLIEPQMVSIYAAIASDQLVFNSQYNLQSFFSGLKAVLDKFPDFVPLELPETLRLKAKVLAVPLDTALFDLAAVRKGEQTSCLNVVWNHRWEYDKGLDRLLRAVELLPPGLHLRLHVLGQHFRTVPSELLQLKALLEQKGMLGHWGFIDDVADYRAFLCRCDVVLSTAIHDFQGLAIMEAATLGCVPLVPDRLAYQELFAEQYRYASYLEQPQREAESLVNALVHLSRVFPALPAAPQMDRWSWAALGPQYRQVFADLLNGYSD